MDEKVIAVTISKVFGEDVGAFERALLRLRLQAELMQINSKIAVVENEQNDQLAQTGQVLAELRELSAAKKKEIDTLEVKK